jgi:4-hydroxyphenylpyruvate dioxygenase-like putative hemolysin
MTTELNLTFHHTGVATTNMEEAIHNYKQLFGEDCASRIFKIHSQKVNVCFIKVGENCFLELVEPSEEDSSIYRLLKKGHSYYHIGYSTKNIESTVEHMVALNYKPFDFFNSEAFNNKRCIFLFSPEGHLLELIEE